MTKGDRCGWRERKGRIKGMWGLPGRNTIMLGCKGTESMICSSWANEGWWVSSNDGHRWALSSVTR